MNPKADFVVGKQTKNTWAGVYGYVPDDKSILQDRGSLYVIVKLHSAVNSDSLESIATLSLDELQRFLYEESVESNFLDHVESSVAAFTKRLETIVAREEELASKGIDFELSLLVIIETYAYLVVVGESDIAILRNEEVVMVSDSLIDSKMQGFLKSGSMLIESDDRFLLSTSKVKKEGEGLLDSILESLDIKKKTSDFIHKDGIAGLVVADTATFELIEKQKQAEEEEKKKKELAALEKAHVDEVEKIDPKIESEKLEHDEELTEEIDNSFLENEEIVLPDEDVNSEEDYAVDDFTEEMSFSERNDQQQLRQRKEQIHAMRQAASNRIKNIFSGIKVFWSERIVGHFKNNKRTYAQIVRGFFGRIQRLGKSGVDFFKREVLGTQTYDRRNMDQRIRRIKRNRIIFVVVSVVVIFGFYFGVTSILASNREKAEKREAETLLASLRSDYDLLASEVLAAKTLSADKKQTVITELSNLESRVNQEKGSTEYFPEEFDSILADIQRQNDELLLINSISQPQVVVDLGALFENVELSDLVYSNGNLFISDESRNVIYKSGVALDSTPQEHISDVTSPRHLVVDSAGDIIVYDQNDSSAISRFSSEQPNSLSRYPGALGNSDIGSVVEVGIFRNTDALYELKTTNQQIYQRDRAGSDYAAGGAIYITSKPPNWKSSPDLARAIDIAAPFEIYVLIEGKGLQRYLSGGDNTIAYETFNNFLREDYAALSDATSFDISDSFLAVADPNNSRVFIFEVDDSAEKKITLIEQYIYRGEGDYFSNLQELIINEQSRKLYILDGSRVLRLDF